MMSPPGSEGRLRSAENTRRLRVCRALESRVTFLGITTAYPCASFGRKTRKWAEEILFPAESALGNSERESLFLLGNTIPLDGKTLAAYPAANTDYFLSGCRLRARTEAVGLRALALLRLVGSFCHGVQVMHTILTGSPRKASLSWLLE